ncbi:MAG: hypothetical protein GX820_01720, partial [Bacteroidales bacterium]|nr:hypothetical protein [Bacteroidales bacterium]
MAVRYHIILAILFIAITCFCTQKKRTAADPDTYSGSASCIECHEKFYELWAPSFHGKAMQPVNKKFTDEYQLPPSEPMPLEGKIYQVTYDDSAMVMLESKNG